MFRVVIKKRSELNMPQIADIPLLEANINEDITQKAATDILVEKVPDNVKVNDLIGIYDSTGTYVYWGVVRSLGKDSVTASQHQALYNDDILIVPQTGSAQQTFYNTKSVSEITDIYLKAKEEGRHSIVNSGTPGVFTGFIDKDVADMYKNITHTIVDAQSDHMPFPLEKGSMNLESFLYDQFNTYNRISRILVNTSRTSNSINLFLFYPEGNIEYSPGKYWKYDSKTLFDTYDMITDLSVIKEEEDINTVYIYNQEGTTLRGSYTVLQDGTIQQITNNTSVENREGQNKSEFIFDTTNDPVALAKSKLPTLQYNHKISFNILFNGEYKFKDFNLGQSIRFYYSKENTTFDSILTGWNYKINNRSENVTNASFTLGKVRNSLTSKLNLKKI